MLQMPLPADPKFPDGTMDVGLLSGWNIILLRDVGVMS
jgi:hypothetical protein